MDSPTPIPVDLGRIAQDLQIRRVQVESVVQLLDAGNTVPFIMRYRKECTGGLSEGAIREIKARVGRLRDLAERKETIIKTIEAQGKLTPELAAAIRSAENPKRLDDLYLPFKPKKKSKAAEAREKGLEPLALCLWNRDPGTLDPAAAAAAFLNPEKELDTAEKVLEGVSNLIAELVSELAPMRDALRRVVWRTGKIVTARAEIPDGEGLEYRDYFNYSEPCSHIPPHRVLAINRGDKEGALKVRLEVARPEVDAAVLGHLPLEEHPHAELLKTVALQAIEQLLLPSMEKEVRRDLTEMAERHAVEVFARNLRSLLLQPPIAKQVVMAIDPGFRTGCKVAILDGDGNLLDHCVIHPHQPQNHRHEAKMKLKDLVGKFQVGVVAIGNGTACRETEELIAEIIAEGTQFHQQAAAGVVQPAAAEPAAPGEPGAAEPAAPAEPAAAAGTAEPAAPAEPAVAAEPAASVGPMVAQSEEPAATGPPPAGAPGEPAPGATPPEGAGGSGEPPAPPEACAPEAAVAPAAAPEAPPASAAEAPAAPEPAGPQSQGLAPATEGDHQPPGGNDKNHSAERNDSHHGSSQPEPVMPPLSGGAPDFEPEPRPEAEAAPAQSPSDPPAAPAELPQAPAAEVGAQIAPASEPAPPPPATAMVEPTAIPQRQEAQPEAPAAAAEQTPQAPPAAAAEAPAMAEPTAPEQPALTAESSATPEAVAPAPPQPAAPSTTPSPAPQKGPGGPRQQHSKQPHRPPRPRPAPAPPAPHPADPLLARLSYVIVNEAGASVYSTSAVGREEFPEFDATLRSAISIGRRLQDPLSELVKIEPQNIGVGLYQHDVNPKQLKESLESVIESCVNFVGVDLNAASYSLLRHVSGLNQLTARRVVEFQKEKGPFQNRAQLMEVEGITPAVFQQAAGFVRVRGGDQPLDRTWVHPETYPVAEQLLNRLGLAADALLEQSRLHALREHVKTQDVPALAREHQVGEFTLRDLLEALAHPDYDPRDELPKPIFKRGVLKLEDLSAGMELKGTVLNVVDFGAFVDIGLKDSGLVHISQLANRYIKSPHDVVSVGDVVTVWVMGVDQERKRVSLTMVKPGTERPRGGPGGRRHQGEGREGGGERRGGPQRHQRREGQPGGRHREREGTPAGQGGAPPAHAQPQPRRPERPAPPPRPAEGQAGPPPRGPAGPHPSQGAGPQQRFQGGRGRGGPRPGQGRFERAQAPRPQPRPSKPAPPLPPLSKDALSGSVPLRTFGQLKQLWQARSEEAAATDAPPPPAASPESAPAASPAPPPLPTLEPPAVAAQNDAPAPEPTAQGPLAPQPPEPEEPQKPQKPQE